MHARATPEDKLRIVRDWKARGAIVAMTGDGVNDAPALREAHIGIAMGRTGTEVTREASDMVLADDNFASIVAAVREGRGIFDNIRKTLVYLLAGNTGELPSCSSRRSSACRCRCCRCTCSGSTSSPTACPRWRWSMDPAERDVMQRPPRPPGEPMLGRSEWRIHRLHGRAGGGGHAGRVRLGAAARATSRGAQPRVLGARVRRAVPRVRGPRARRACSGKSARSRNLRLLGVVVISVLVQLGIHHIPATQALFQIGTLSLFDCTLSLIAGSVPFAMIEVTKVVKRVARRA